MSQTPALHVAAKDVAKSLRLSANTIYRLLREGRIEHILVGRSYRVPVDEMKRILKEGVR